jgi:hypothetical protein
MSWPTWSCALPNRTKRPKRQSAIRQALVQHDLCLPLDPDVDDAFLGNEAVGIHVDSELRYGNLAVRRESEHDPQA